MATLESRIEALEAGDGHWVIIRPCPACGAMAPGPETTYLCGSAPPCTRGQAHGDIPPPGPQDIVIQRTYPQNTPLTPAIDEVIPQ